MLRSLVANIFRGGWFNMVQLFLNEAGVFYCTMICVLFQRRGVRLIKFKGILFDGCCSEAAMHKLLAINIKKYEICQFLGPKSIDFCIYIDVALFFLIKTATFAFGL